MMKVTLLELLSQSILIVIVATYIFKLTDLYKITFKAAFINAIPINLGLLILLFLAQIDIEKAWPWWYVQ